MSKYYCPECKQERDKRVVPKVQNKHGKYVCQHCITRVYPSETAGNWFAGLFGIGAALVIFIIYGFIA